MLTIEKENEISDCQKEVSKHFSQLIEKLKLLTVHKEAEISNS